MLKEIPKSDIVSRPIKLYKEWTLDHNDVPPIFGENPAGSFIDVDTDAKSHKYVKKIVYSSILYSAPKARFIPSSIES